MSTTLPDRTNGTTGIVDAATNSGQQKTNLGNLRDFIADLFGTTTAALRTVWEAFRLHGPDTLANASLSFSVGSSALTIALKTRAGATPSATDPVLVSQRSATAGNGDFNLRAVTAATSLVVSSGSTLGLLNSDSTPLYVYLLDNAGTQELAISQKWFGASGIVSTTAEGGGGLADSPTVMYSTTARTNVPFRAIGRITAPQTTAGTWAAVPTACQLVPFPTPEQARAWVRFSVSGGVVTINARHNVSSVTRNATGDYTINFATAFATANYGFAITAGRGANTGAGACGYIEPFNADPTASAFRFITTNLSGSAGDTPHCSATFFGEQ